MCPEEMIELNSLVELPVVELTGADCTSFVLFIASKYLPNLAYDLQTMR